MKDWVYTEDGTHVDRDLRNDRRMSIHINGDKAPRACEPGIWSLGDDTGDGTDDATGAHGYEIMIRKVFYQSAFSFYLHFHWSNVTRDRKFKSIVGY